MLGTCSQVHESKAHPLNLLERLVCVTSLNQYMERISRHKKENGG